jgi:hypothetical protein
VLLIFGAPDRSPSASSIADALLEAGLDLRRLEFERVDREGARRYLAETSDGARYFVALLKALFLKVVGARVLTACAASLPFSCWPAHRWPPGSCSDR